MAGPEDLNLAVVSDLHLSEGRDPKTRKFHRNEDFFFDGPFDRFLSYLEASSARRGRKWRLVIAGDMVDFLQITGCPEKPAFTLRKSETEYGLGTSPEKNHLEDEGDDGRPLDVLPGPGKIFGRWSQGCHRCRQS